MRVKDAYYAYGALALSGGMLIGSVAGFCALFNSCYIGLPPWLWLVLGLVSLVVAMGFSLMVLAHEEMKLRKSGKR